MNEVRGAVFPVPHEFIERILLGERDVFVKFGRFISLSKSQKIQFYDSSVHAIVGEALIEKKEYMEPSKVWEVFGSRIFLNKDEFNEYIFNDV